MPQRLPNTKAKVAGVCIYKPGRDSAISTMTMNQGQIAFAHLPSLSDNFAESSVENDFRWVVTVEVNLHFQPLVPDT
jgi:hypothetical protein